jgi:hypothetical protein
MGTEESKKVVAKEELKAASKYQYKGPAYNQGLLLPDGSRIRPLEMSDQEIEAAIAKFPMLKEYFSV